MADGETDSTCERGTFAPQPRIRSSRQDEGTEHWSSADQTGLPVEVIWPPPFRVLRNRCTQPVRERHMSSTRT
jgi:hypothetical protein